VTPRERCDFIYDIRLNSVASCGAQTNLREKRSITEGKLLQWR
jgi:hypothetical protein